MIRVWLTVKPSAAAVTLSKRESTSSRVLRVNCGKDDSSLCKKDGKERQAVSSPIESVDTNPKP